MSLFLSPSQVNPPGAGFNAANYKNPGWTDCSMNRWRPQERSRRLQIIGQLLEKVERSVLWPLYAHLTFGAL